MYVIFRAVNDRKKSSQCNQDFKEYIRNLEELKKERRTMPIYKIKYIKECEHIMEVKADSKEDALKKFETFDYIKDYEHQCIHEEIIDIEDK